MRLSRRVAARASSIVVVTVALSCVALCSASASLAASTILDPNDIACPAAPAGWTNPPDAKSVVTPETVPDPTAGSVGGNQDEVGCTYFGSGIRQVTISVTYALPTDFNPISDFYWGCGHGSYAWNDTDRVFRVSSLAQWANVTFYDPTNWLHASDVPAFEGVATQLLQNATGYGHPCNTKVQPTPFLSRYNFDFEVAGTLVASTFWTNGTGDASGLEPIVQLNTFKVTFKVKSAGKTVPLTIELERGLDYLPKTATSAGRVRLAVQVMKTGVTSCAKGTTGTLTFTTAPSVRLSVCKQVFLQDGSPGRIRIF